MARMLLPKANSKVPLSSNQGMSRRKTCCGVLSSSSEPASPPTTLVSSKGINKRRGTLSRFRYAPVLAANPGQRATVLVALASTAGTPVLSNAGNVRKVPPPATAFSVPPITAARNKKMAWLRCNRNATPLSSPLSGSSGSTLSTGTPSYNGMVHGARIGACQRVSASKDVAVTSPGSRIPITRERDAGHCWAQPKWLVFDARIGMGTTCVAPEVETPVEKTRVRIDQTKPAGWKQRVRDLLIAIFEGHEEFLGWTPD